MNNDVKLNSNTATTQNNDQQQVASTIQPPINQQLPVQHVIVDEAQVNQQQPNQNIEVSHTQMNQEVPIQNQLQSIPTVDQNEQDFINNVQSMNQEKKEEKKEGINFTFIILLFIIILATIYFLFPILLKHS